tara:strand:+ start:86 stop:523 length:438 start_codon:yes stop_codon:yes gene_type:complete
MKEDFVMRGQTASGATETLNFGGHKDGYGFLLTEFQIYPSNPQGSETILGSITAGKTAVAPEDPNFNVEGLIGTAMKAYNTTAQDGSIESTIVNDTFVITQDLILMVLSATTSEPVNWQCRFRPVKLDTAKQALTNYRQFMIFDE